jgi:hypothetical protein
MVIQLAGFSPLVAISFDPVLKSVAAFTLSPSAL